MIHGATGGRDRFRQRGGSEGLSDAAPERSQPCHGNKCCAAPFPVIAGFDDDSMRSEMRLPTIEFVLADGEAS